MLSNRFMPQCTVIPVLAYPEVVEAAKWLCNAFGFAPRLRIGDHRAQLNVSDGAVVLTKQHSSVERPSGSIMARVENVDQHFDHASRSTARILSKPSDQPHGERQYTVQDFAGHTWTFSQSIADVNPKDWGGTPREL